MSLQLTPGWLWAGWFAAFVCLYLPGCGPGEEALLENIRRDALSAQSVLDSIDVQAGQTNLLVKLVSDAPADLAGKAALADIIRRIAAHGNQVAADQNLINEYVARYQTLQADYSTQKVDRPAAEASLATLQKEVQALSVRSGQWRTEWNGLRSEFSTIVRRELNKE